MEALISQLKLTQVRNHRCHPLLDLIFGLKNRDAADLAPSAEKEAYSYQAVGEVKWKAFGNQTVKERREQKSERASEQESTRAREPESKRAREHESKRVREHESKRARAQAVRNEVLVSGCWSLVTVKTSNLQPRTQA